MIRPALLLLTAAVLAIPTASASAATPPIKKCGSAGTNSSGLGVTNVRARVATCSAARKLAKKVNVPGEGETTTTTSGGVKWKCTTTEAATGSDPAMMTARTKVQCIRSKSSKALVRFELQS